MQSKKILAENSGFNNEKYVERQALMYIPFSLRIAVNYVDIPTQ